MDPMEAIKQTYFQECEELLLSLEEGLSAMDRGEGDGEAINAVFRAVHSIKGSGGAFGFEPLVAFAHIFETVLDHLRSGGLQLSESISAVLLRAADLLADHVAAARGGRDVDAQADSALKAELASLAGEEEGGMQPAPADFDDLEFIPALLPMMDLDAPAAPQGWTIAFAPHAQMYAKANEPALLLRELARLGRTEVSIDLARMPALDLLDPLQSYLGWTVTLHGDVTREAVEEIFEFVAGDCELTITPLSAAVEVTPVAPAAILAEIMPVEAKPAQAVSQAETVKQSIRVDLDKVDRLVNLVGELVITQAMLTQRVAESRIPRTSLVGDGLVALDHLLRELQENVMAIRTQPVKSVFQRMPRLVRELAAQTGKKVRLVVEGEGTEVDKTVIERLGEPLTHMIRNAVDHGLETPEERIAAGKPEEGTVTLSAEHCGGRIVIEVTDDGRGIDRSRVRQKAIERQLISASASLTEEEVDNLIFLPGFSTAAQVSNISGRGVGMDVVRRNIVDLGGRITIGSAPSCGSRFSLTLPLTLAVLDGMVVSVGGETFVLPLAHIVESLKPQPSDIRPFSAGRDLLNVRGAYVPLMPTGELMGVKGAVSAADGVVILVESQGAGRMALVVDAILGQHQVVIKSFESNYRRIDGIAAATILGDGRVALILDVDGLVERCRQSLNSETAILATGT